MKWCRLSVCCKKWGVSLALLPLLFFSAKLHGEVKAAEPSNSDITFGMSASLLGSNAETGQQMRLGVSVAFEKFNRAGGFQGKRLKLLALDDGYDPIKTAPNVRRLIEKDKVLGIIGNTGTPTSLACIPIINETQTLFFAPYTGADALRKKIPQRYVIHFRASYSEEINGMIEALVTKGGIKPDEIAFFTQRDAFGNASFNISLNTLKKYGLTDPQKILHARYERNSVAVENALATFILAKKEPKAIIMIGAYEPCAKFIKLAVENQFTPLFLGVSFSNSSAMSRSLAGTRANIAITQVVPIPEMSNLPIAKEYLEDLKAYDSNAVPNVTSFEGYIAGRILTLSLGKVQGPTISRDNIVDALLDLGEFDLGLGYKLSLSPSEHQASHQIWPSRYLAKEGRFVPCTWDEFVRPIKKGANP